GRVYLQHQGVTEAVDDRTGDAVGFGMGKAVEGNADHALADLERARQPLAEEADVDFSFRIPRQQTRSDQRVPVEQKGALRGPITCLETYEASGRQSLGLRRHLDLVGKGPGMAKTKPLLRLRLQPDDGPIARIFYHARENRLSGCPVQHRPREQAIARAHRYE